jgi:hypothetical protein
MHLTGPQFRTVKYYLDHRDHAPTWAEFARRYTRYLVLWTMTGVAASYLFTQMGFPMLAYLVVGMFAGAALREMRQHHHVIRAWPAIALIVNWDRARELVTETEGPPG